MTTTRRKSSQQRSPGEAIKLGQLDDFVGFNLRLAQETSFGVFAQHTAAPHLKPGRFASLMIIHENPGLSQIELARAIARDKSSVTPLIRGLWEDGLVERRPSAVDRRSVTLWLTPSGQEALRSLLAHARRHDRKLDAIVGSDKAGFIALLKKITNELR
jgi:DNA-binding MarR family transcriptional regulator